MNSSQVKSAIVQNLSASVLVKASLFSQFKEKKKGPTIIKSVKDLAQVITAEDSWVYGARQKSGTDYIRTCTCVIDALTLTATVHTDAVDDVILDIDLTF